jgi:hypothetical protein
MERYNSFNVVFDLSWEGPVGREGISFENGVLLDHPALEYSRLPFVRERLIWSSTAQRAISDAHEPNVSHQNTAPEAICSISIRAPCQASYAFSACDVHI